MLDERHKIMNELVICPSCGTKVAGGHRCSSCGASLVQRRVESPVPPATDSPQVPFTSPGNVSAYVQIIFRIVGLLMIVLTLGGYGLMIVNTILSGLPAQVVFNWAVTLNVVGFCGMGAVIMMMSRWLTQIVMR